MLQKDSLIRGAFILTAGALLSRALGGIYRFILPTLLGGGEQGAYGVGLFGYAYQIYVVALTISSVGLPLAISKLVSQRLAEGDEVGAHEVFQASRTLLGGLGLVFTLLLMAFAPWLAQLLDPNALYSL
ncbi:MAG TPA: oligosaccharide flippase family protein, partial [Bacillota bacterium]